MGRRGDFARKGTKQSFKSSIFRKLQARFLSSRLWTLFCSSQSRAGTSGNCSSGTNAQKVWSIVSWLCLSLTCYDSNCHYHRSFFLMASHTPWARIISSTRCGTPFKHLPPPSPAVLPLLPCWKASVSATQLPLPSPPPSPGSSRTGLGWLEGSSLLLL